uniref:Uncharacterized protein n=1 Tax=Anguilla anguilla TaxID=7936 RepID=A0A0E9R0I3_ANGAN
MCKWVQDYCQMSFSLVPGGHFAEPLCEVAAGSDATRQ